MRLFAVWALASMCAACGQQPEPVSPAPTTKTAVVQLNPARIDRARDELPEGYEVTGYAGPPAPISLWGFGDPAVAEPAQCTALAAPAVDPATARGWSASGPGGIVYAVVAGSTDPDAPDPALLAECAQWTVESGHTTGTVTGQPAPAIDDAQTVAMTTAVSTRVEGGTETRSRAVTFVAYLGDHVCFVTLVTDPGSPYPTLDAGFAADLLVSAVSALRG